MTTWYHRGKVFTPGHGVASSSLQQGLTNVAWTKASDSVIMGRWDFSFMTPLDE